MKKSDVNILCVDGDPKSCEWLRGVFAAAKISRSVTTIQTGAEALRFLKSEPIDLIVMDYALPDTTGVNLCLDIREIDERVPIIFLTALNTTIDRDMARAAGADEYLVKPDDMSIFVDTVIHLLQVRRPTPATSSPQGLRAHSPA